MKLIIHRGTHEIGGSCVEISTKNTTILIDIGEPLNPKAKNISLKGKKIDAVLISHPHMDHYGQLGLISEQIPVYTGDLTKRLMDSVATFTTGRYLRNKFVHFKKDRAFDIGDFRITPLLVDHSAYDAYSFLVEAEGKKIVYSGDFRSNGFKGFLFEDVIKKLRDKNIDILLMEGTCLERSVGDFPEEIDVARKIEEIISKQNNVSFLVSSSSNFDMMISASLACDNANKIFVVDIYTAWIMEQMKTISRKEPLLDKKHVKVLSRGWQAGRYYIKIKGNAHYNDFIKKIYSYGNDISMKDIQKDPSKHLLKLSDSFIPGLVKDFADKSEPVPIIYSMWRGYDTYQNLQKLRNIDFYYAHTSGHAPLDTLKDYAKMTAPRKLIPIHTENPENYHKHFANVSPVNDGDIIEI
jgi:ribonuclease J